MEHPNLDLIRRGYADFLRGGIGAAFWAMDESVVWHIGGRSPLAGDYKGHYELNVFFQKVMELTDGSFDLEPHDYLANDTHAIALVTEKGRRNGKNHRMRVAHIWHAKDANGTAGTEMWRFPEDTYRDDEFWS